MQFTDLPQDVIDTVIFFLPDERSIQALGTTCRTLHDQIANSSYIWQLLFKKSFGTQPTPFQMRKWPELYNLRRKGRIYAWGTPESGRLGFTASEVPKDFLIRRLRSGIAKPFQVPATDQFVIADLSAGGFSFQFLTGDGEIYCLGNWHSGNKGPGPNERDYRRPLPGSENVVAGSHRRTRNGVPPPPDIFRRLGVRLGGVVVDAQPFQPPVPRTLQHAPQPQPQPQTQPQPEKKEKPYNRFMSKETTVTDDDEKFVSISSGRCHFIALDTAGKVWSWDDPRTGHGVQISFRDKDRSDLEHKGHKVLKCLAGWSSSCAYLYGFGLCYWDKRLPLKKGEVSAEALYKCIPNTGDINGDQRVVDFVIGNGYMVYLTAEGKLYRNDMIGEESFELVEFAQSLKEKATSLKPKFTRLSGNFSTFVAFSNEDLVFFGSKTSNSPQIIEELQHQKCIDVSVGDYHFLALLEDGTLLSWGLESQLCGCLGLGKENAAYENEGNSRRVRKPTVVETEGKVLAIAAAGWHSGAIIA